MVSQIMTIERQPLTKLQKQAKTNEAKISGYGNINNYMSQMQSALQALTSSTSSFYATKTSNTDDKVATIASTGTGQIARHSLNVTRLATYDKYASSDLARLADKTSTVGEGTLNFSSGSNNFAVTTTATTTLSDLASYINNNTDNTTMTASVVNDGSGYRLMLSARNSGTAGQIAVTSNDIDGVNNDLNGLSRFATANMTHSITGQDATFTLDGVSMTSSSNTLKDVVDGATITLKGLGSTDMSEDVDYTATQDKIQKFVDAYNKLNTEMKNARTNKTDPLYADPNLSQIQRNLQNEFNISMSGTFSYAAQAGLAFDKNGALTVDSKMLQDAMQKNPDALSNIFKGDGNLGSRLENQTKVMLRNDGIIESKKQNLTKLGQYLTQQQEMLSDRLDRKQEQLTKQYSTLDANLSKMMQSISQLQSMFG